MKKPVAKYIWYCILCTMGVAATTIIFIRFILPEFDVDRQQLVEEEMLEHNEKLDLILADFSSVLTLDNVDVDMKDNELHIVIYGEACTLNVTLNKSLKVLSLNSEDNTDEQRAALITGTVALSIATIIAVSILILNIRNIVVTAKENKKIKANLNSGKNVVV